MVGDHLDHVVRLGGVPGFVVEVAIGALGDYPVSQDVVHEGLVDVALEGSISCVVRGAEIHRIRIAKGAFLVCTRKAPRYSPIRGLLRSSCDLA